MSSGLVVQGEGEQGSEANCVSLVKTLKSVAAYFIIGIVEGCQHLIAVFNAVALRRLHQANAVFDGVKGHAGTVEQKRNKGQGCL